MQENQENASVKREDLLFTAAARFTGAYLFLVVMATLLNFAGYDRWLFGFNPDLEANAVGDTLAGTFAPLAFLWFFVSTWLQRRELKETRVELANQAKEMKKAAEESANQTRIMQSREVYEEHRQRLYYLAAFIWRDVLHNEIKVKVDREIVELNIVDIPYSNFGFNEENLTVDALLQSLNANMNKAIEILSSPGVSTPIMEQNMSPATRDFYGLTSDASPYNEVMPVSASVHYIASELRSLTRNEQYRKNPLIAARIRGIDLDGTTDAAEVLADKFTNFLIDSIRQ
jgi:hypothetical protein